MVTALNSHFEQPEYFEHPVAPADEKADREFREDNVRNTHQLW